MRPKKSLLLESIDPLDWLRSYEIYPKFYWKSKESELEFATLGIEEKIYDLNEISNHENMVNIVLSFDLDPKKSQIWVPTFELINSNSTTSMLSYKSDFPKKIKPYRFRKNKIKSSLFIPDFNIWDKTITESKKSLLKVVLARKESIKTEKDLDELAIFSNLRKKSKNSFLFYYQPNPQEAFLGASPETLFIKDQQKIISESIAGTRKRGKSLNEDLFLENELIKSNKELREFRFVKDQIELIYKKICSEYEIAETDICKTKWVQHLRTKFIGILKNNLTIKELLYLFHPTPAVGGVPKKEALAFINNFEPFDRSFYAAPIGRASKLNAEFAVGIRSCHIKKNQIDVFAGAGIIDSSNSRNEWEELKNKSSWIYEVI